MTPSGLLVVAFLFLQPAPQVGQRPAPAAASGTVSGSLTAADTGLPVRKAQMRLVRAAPRAVLTTTTDGDGRWTFADVAPGDYTLSATRPGFIEAVFGARRPGPAAPGTAIIVAAGQKIEGLAMTLPRGGVISGVVVDEFGDPAYLVQVQALRYVFRNGERVVETAAAAFTDDLGAYRVSGLPPGTYLLIAVPRDTVAMMTGRAEAIRQRAMQVQAAAQDGSPGARAMAANIEDARRAGSGAPPVPNRGYVPMYHPASPLVSGAVNVRIGLGQHVAGIDVRLAVVDTGTITGRLLAVDGQPVPGNVQLVDPAMPVSGVGALFAPVDPRGGFSIGGVVPGAYVVRGHNSPPGTIGAAPGGTFQISGPLAVSVAGGETVDVEVRVQPGSLVSARLSWEGVDVPFDRSRVRVSLEPLTTASDWEVPVPVSLPDAENRVTWSDVPAGRYRALVNGLPGGWSLASAVFDGVDAADVPIAIEAGTPLTDGVLTFTNRTGLLEGVVRTAQSSPAPREFVVLFPTDPKMHVARSRRIRVALTGRDGAYSFTNLPPGEYGVASLSDFESGQEFDPAFLARVTPLAATITIGPGARAVEDLRVR